MGAQPVQGFDPITALDVKKVRELFQQFEDVCPTPTLWERAFYELLDCFPSPEASAKAFAALDSDNDGLVDAREMFGALAVLCKGHLTERLKLLFHMFDLNKENDMGFDEAFFDASSHDRWSQKNHRLGSPARAGNSADGPADLEICESIEMSG